MNSLTKIFAVIIALIITCAILPKQASAQEGAVNFQVFYDQLSPYGQWVDYPNYGYVWFPDAGPDFAPYSTGGYWVLSDDGWTWVSDYEWGWAPFHYGRWDYDNAYGWFWVPDNVWGPAWVTWRQGDGYYGWAPMRPGVGIEVYAGGSYEMPGNRWIFVRDRDFRRHDVDRYRVEERNNVTIINNSTAINRVYTDNDRHARYAAGPDRNDVQKATGKTVTLVVIHDSNKPGQAMSHGQLQMYRPQVGRGNRNEKKPVPSRVVNATDVKPPSERTVLTRPRNINSTNSSRGNQQPPSPRSVNPSISKAQGQQPRTTNSTSNNRGKQHSITPPRKAKSTVNRVKGPQRQTANPYNKKDSGKPSQPRPRQENEKHD